MIVSRENSCVKTPVRLDTASLFVAYSGIGWTECPSPSLLCCSADTQEPGHPE